MTCRAWASFASSLKARRCCKSANSFSFVAISIFLVISPFGVWKVTLDSLDDFHYYTTKDGWREKHQSSLPKRDEM